MKTLLWLLCVAVVSSVTTYFYGQNFYGQSNLHEHKPTQSSFSSNDLAIHQEIFYQEKIQALENNNSALIQQIKQYKAEITALIQARSAAVLSTNAVSETLPEKVLSNEELERRINAKEQAKEFSDYMNSVSGSTSARLYQDMEKRFSAEAVDNAWANDYEAKVKKLFQIDKELSYFVPDGIECRTSKCQIKVHVSDNEEANRLTQGFSTLVNANSVGVHPSAVISLPDFNKGIVSIYIAKNSTTKIYQ